MPPTFRPTTRARLPGSAITDMASRASARQLETYAQRIAQASTVLGYPYPSFGAWYQAMHESVILLARTLTVEEARSIIQAHSAELTAAYGAGFDHLVEVESYDASFGGKLLIGLGCVAAGIALGASIGGPFGALIGAAIGLVVGIVLNVIPFEKIAFVDAFKNHVDKAMQPIDRYAMLSGVRQWIDKAWAQDLKDYAAARGSTSRRVAPPVWQTRYSAQAEPKLVGPGNTYLSMVFINCWDLLNTDCIPDPRVPLPSGSQIRDPKTWHPVALYGVCALTSDVGDEGFGVPLGSAKMGLQAPGMVKQSARWTTLRAGKGSTWLVPYLEAAQNMTVGGLRTLAANWTPNGYATGGAVSLAKPTGTVVLSRLDVVGMPDISFPPMTAEIAALVQQRQEQLGRVAQNVARAAG